MHIGVPKEIKPHEYRVGLIPANVRELVSHGHTVSVETGAGEGVGMIDVHYQAAGANILPKASDVFAIADMIIKVKEPLPLERKMLQQGQVLFTYLHLAPDPEQANDLIRSGATCIAYETVTSCVGGLPLLAPMSEVAGRMSIQAGAHYLEKTNGGLGILLGGVPGADVGKVVVLGGGVVGTHAIDVALGMGADVWVVDNNIEVLRYLWRQFGNRLNTVFSTIDAIEHYCVRADLVIGGVLTPGSTAPKLVSAGVIKKMKPGSVVVNVAIDQGGCFETSHPTTHDEPTFIVDGIIHYCVANMPGAVPCTSTKALNNATLPYIMEIADKGWRKALLHDANLRAGLNVHAGYITNEAVAESLSKEFYPVDDIIRQ
ncbi:MAG: alanine dehydrogenase [Hyphomicrobiaceae bacterium]|nr:alanine dehydrogenase [Hyphomicrobiaceae bacterium]